MKVSCKYCGDIFNVAPAEIKRGNGKYCSRLCRGKDQRGEKNPNFVGKEKYNCSTCGKEFFQYASEYKRKNRKRKYEEKYCSKKCSAKGKMEDKDGYILIYKPDNPNANSAGFIREHRLIMELRIGRLLLPDEIVHHLDGNKSNNKESNLQIITKSEHHRIHALDRHRNTKGSFA